MQHLLDLLTLTTSTFLQSLPSELNYLVHVFSFQQLPEPPTSEILEWVLLEDG